MLSSAADNLKLWRNISQVDAIIEKQTNKNKTLLWSLRGAIQNVQAVRGYVDVTQHF